MLRASSEHEGVDVNLGNVFGQELTASAVAKAALLVAFAEAATREQIGQSTADVDFDALRDDVARQMGFRALVDVAAVVAMFNAVVIVADATGIPLEPYKAELSEGLRQDLGLDQFRLD